MEKSVAIGGRVAEGEAVVAIETENARLEVPAERGSREDWVRPSLRQGTALSNL